MGLKMIAEVFLLFALAVIYCAISFEILQAQHLLRENGSSL